MTDDEVIDATRDLSRLYGPIIHVPCDTAAGREVATVDLRFDPPKVERKFEGRAALTAESGGTTQ